MAEPETPRKTRKKATTGPTAVTNHPDWGKVARAPREGLAPNKKPGATGHRGNLSLYTQAIATRMCNLLSDGVPLREICRQEGFPAWPTVYDWMVRDDALGAAGAGLSIAIARAREIGQDAIAEEIWLDMKRDPERIIFGDGNSRVDAGYVQWQKAKAEIALKLLAKWNPKRYGDRVQLSGDAENPIRVQAETEADRLFAALLQNVELRRQAGDEPS